MSVMCCYFRNSMNIRPRGQDKEVSYPPPTPRPPAVKLPRLVVAPGEVLRGGDAICQLSDRQCCVHIVILLGKMSMPLLKLVVGCSHISQWVVPKSNISRSKWFFHQFCVWLAAPPPCGSSTSLILNRECHRGGSGSCFVWLVGPSIQTDSRIQCRKPWNAKFGQECFVFPIG